MVAVDKRGTLIVSTAGNFFGVSISNAAESVEGESVLEKFLDVSTCRTICASPNRTDTDGINLKLTNEIPIGRNALVFFKLRASIVTDENFHELIHIATTGGPRISGTALIESLRQVWAPTLQSSGVNATCLKRLEEDILGPKASSSISDEENLWRHKRDDAKKPREKKIAEEAFEITKSIRVELENSAISREGLIGVEEILETVSGYVDDLWKLDGPAYNEERMRCLLEILGNEIVRLVQALLDEVRSTDSRARDEAVATAATVCEKWVNICERLTTLYWPHQSLHPWKGTAFIHTRCSKFGDRLRQTAEIRAQHRQLTRLLTTTERSALGTDALLQSFDDLRVGLGEDGKDVEWERLKRRFEDSLSPAEEKVTEKLRKQIAGAQNSTILAAEFQRYVELLKREALRRALRSERESLLASIGELVDSYQAGPDTANLLDSPRILQEVQSARAAEMRLDNLGKLTKELLSDLPGYDEASAKISAASKEAEKKRQYLVDSWVEETKSAIERKELSLSNDSSVVELTGSSMMRVNYDPRLTILVREARALAGQGVELPREVRDLVERAGALAGRARALQQVANFHNTIGDRMVPSQRPLMLVTALELARAVREQSGVVWSDPYAVDTYTNRLRELVKKFARQNSELAAKHASLRDLVAGLLKGEIVNLVGSQSAWKEALKNIRTIVESVEKDYGNTKAWKLHWDRQLLKVLGVAYRAALPALTRKLPEIRVELTFRDSNLQWRPPLEEIRAKLYSGLRRFLAIPTNFRGVGDPADGQFDGLVDRSAYLYGGVYKEAEVALAAIEAVRVKWIPLAAPAKIDIGARLKGKSPQEWERAFKDAKQWAQEVGKLRGGEVKIWCISIDTATTRNDLESATRRYWDRLSSDLRSEASARLVTVVEFLSTAARELDRRPRNVEEVGLAYEVHSRIQGESSAMAEELEAVTGFARVLAAWTREKLDGLSSAHGAWEGLSERLERHQSLVARQLEDAKVNLRHRAVALQDEKERWEAKWSVKPELITLDWISAMRERWTTMNEQKKSLRVDCQRLEVNLDDVLQDDHEVTRRLEAQLDAEEANCRFQAEFIKELDNQTTEEWSVARKRLPRLHDWLDSWETRIKTQTPDDTAEFIDETKDSSLEVDTFVGKKIREMRSDVEFLQLLRGDELAEEHWAELRPLLGIVDVTNTRDITLGHLLKSSKMIRDNVDRVQEIAKRAIAESGIRQALAELESWETTASLQLVDSKDSKNVPILLVGEYGELLARAGELKLILEGAKGASGYERFAARAARSEAAMFELEERIKALSILQRKWVYLEPVYGSGAAPNDSGRWTRADKEFRYLMGEVARDPRVPSLRRLPLPALSNLKDHLDRCQRSLDEFLEEKRSSYPRLYFLSDEDLLELVSGSGGGGIDAHLPKLYQGIGSTMRESHKLQAVVSREGEILNLHKPIDLTEALPQWLSSLEGGMREALSQSLEKCLVDTAPDPSLYPAQVLLLSERIHFTERCESALKEGTTSMKNLIERLETQRARFRGLEDAGDRLTALKARGLLLDTVHHLGVVRTLLKAMENRENTTWTWSRQLRSYRTSNGPVIRCGGADFPYRFEYQGAAVGLVRTPLTERCFLALTQAMKLGLGGSPTGPAGTGKTESVKALAAILGRLVLVFNCDEGMDATSMRRILGGLAQAGAWGCFDEFNRLEEETLSAVAMLVRPLQEAVRDSLSSVQLGEQSVRLDPHCCVFITMNPADSDYGGRHKLPDSLARLFRPIGMAHPDRCDIARALLECEGFLEAPTLAKQLVECLEILEKLLFKQPHYDWGLRALRSILDAIPTDSSGSTKLNETERFLVAMRSSTLPKLTEEDTEKFVGLLKDVFPKIDQSSFSVDPTTRQDLLTVLNDVCQSAGFSDDTVNRCIQLYGQLKNRTGVAIVGPPGSGKTLVRKILFDCLNKIGEPVKQFVLHPGAMPKTRLLGKVDPRTREWKEGLLSSIISTCGDTSTWIVLNGDVEPGWAEALNSALDDNRLLTLPSGVGLRLGNGVRFIFETHKLGGASPATVSRLGVIHLGSKSPLSLLSRSKLEDLSPVTSEITNTHLCKIIENILKITDERKSAAGLIEGALIHLRNANTQNQFAYALLVSLCGQLGDAESADDIARLIYQSTDSWCPDPQKPFAVLYNPEIDRLEPFGEALPSIQTEAGPISLSGPVKRALAAIIPWLESSHPAIIRGPEGCGKSSFLSAALASRNDEINEASTIVRGSSLYGPEDLVTRLKRSCIRVESSANGRNYKPRNGARLVLILEDLHLASKDLQELIRELLQDGGFYEEDLEFASLPITLLCTGDNDTRLHPRLEALLATHYLPSPGSKDLISIVELHLQNSVRMQASSSSWVSRMANTMIETVTAVGISRDTTFRWTPNDLALWADCLRCYPATDDEVEWTRHLWDAGMRMFYPRLVSKDQTRWISTMLSRIPELKNTTDDVFVWKGGNSGLVAYGGEGWRAEIENAASKCAREGEPVQATITEHLVKTISGLSWAMGSGNRGVMLTGRPGAGRKTATKLAASVSSLRLIDSAPGRARTAVKAAIQAAGIEGEPCLLLLEEHHLREPGLAILAGALISRGELPGLLSPDELDGLISPLADLARKEDFAGSLDQYLYHRLRALLRVVVILDIGEIRKDWLIRSGLLRHCVLVAEAPGNDWWSSESSLKDLSSRLTENDEISPQKVSPGLDTLVHAHLRAPRQQQAPARFLALLSTWADLRNEWRGEVEKKLSSLEAGIARLREAGERVAKLEDEASKQRQELEAEKGRANAALEQITATMRGATGQRGEMASLKVDTERESSELARRKADIESELGKVEPLVEQAAQAVAGIGADALAEVRSLRAPPAPVRDVLEGVLRLMGIRDTSWNSMKTFLAKRGVKDEIRTWDARRSTPASLEAVAKLVKERPESFEEKTAKRASIAAAPLAAWVLANLQYGQILEQVAPLEREQRVLAERLSAAEAQLGKLAAGLTSVESRVAQLQEELAEHSRGAAALQLRTEATESSLTTARALLQKLDAEHNDWQSQLESLTERKTRLDVEAAEVASLLVYQDPGRDDKWKKSAIDLLITERERLLWRAQDLPADTASLVGAACSLRGPLVPLFLDPSGVAVKWLKSNIGVRLEVTKPEDPKFVTTLELAVRFGKPLLIEEIVELPSLLLPLLRMRPLRLGERTLPAQQGFKMFLATRRETLIDSLPSEADAVSMSITLGAGSRSLAERFIEKVLLTETPELEVQRKEALEQEEKLSGERDQARLDLLAQLGAARGQDLLQESQNGSQGVGLLSSLEATQEKAREIAIALEKSRRSHENVAKRAKEHEKLAKFAAHLFKAVRALGNLSPLYVFSVEAFTDIYLEAENSRASSVTTDRKEQESLIEKTLVALTLRNCTNSAYRRHRLPLALHLALSLNPVPEVERNLLLDGASLKNDDRTDYQLPEWIPEERKSAVKSLASTLPQVASRLKPAWVNDVKNIYVDQNLTSFQKTLAVQALRPDHLHTALTKLATELLGVKDLTPPTWDLKKIAEERAEYPVLLLLSPGADPGPELEALASSKIASCQGFMEISLGQGQVNQAEMALEAACRTGSWVLLSNLQLALNWLPRLEGILRSNICTRDKNSSTRIWLTTEECSGFYPGLAGLCRKLAYEPPEGVKRNVARSLQQLQQRRPNSGNVDGNFVLAWIHAVLQERRRFVPQGWIRAYEWSEADLEAARKLILSNDIPKGHKSGRIDWEPGRGLLDVAVYGGRIQDEYDMRALHSILRDIWSRDIFEGRRKLAGVLAVSEVLRKDPTRMIEQLNDLDSPVEYFGLPANAHRAWERAAAEKALLALKGMSSKSSSSNDRRSHKKVETKYQSDLKNYLDQRISTTISNRPESREKSCSPVERFLSDERKLVGRLINFVKLDVNSSKVVDSRTPANWLEDWPTGPREVSSFVNSLVAKNQFLTSYKVGLPERVDLAHFTRPWAFLAAFKQHTVRQSNCPLEELRLDANWRENSEDNDWKVFVNLDGILISGAIIENGMLKELDATAPPVAALKNCRISFVPKMENDDTKDRLDIPVYADSQRNQLICSLPVECNRDEHDSWLRKGVILHLRNG